MTVEQVSIGEQLRRAVWQRRPQDALLIIDAHAHMGTYGRFFVPAYDTDALAASLQRCGVRRMVFSSHLAIELDAPAGNQLTADFIARRPDLFAGYLTVNPRQDPVGQLRRWGADERFWGIKVHPDLHEYPLDGPLYEPVFTFAEQTGCPVLTHCWAGSPYDDLGQVATIAKRHPQAMVLVGHSGAVRTSFERAAQVAAEHPNLLLEICGSWSSAAEIIRMIQHVGSAQVIFGSDAPFIDMRISLGRLVFSNLDDVALHDVLHRNAERVFAWRAAAEPARTAPAATSDPAGSDATRAKGTS